MPSHATVWPPESQEAYLPERIPESAFEKGKQGIELIQPPTEIMPCVRLNNGSASFSPTITGPPQQNWIVSSSVITRGFQTNALPLSMRKSRTRSAREVRVRSG